MNLKIYIFNRKDGKVLFKEIEHYSKMYSSLNAVKLCMENKFVEINDEGHCIKIFSNLSTLFVTNIWWF